MASAVLPPSLNWLVLVAQLPEDAGARLRVLRMLDAMGCAVLREGVFILPRTPAALQGLERLGEHVTAAGGSHHVLHVTSSDAQSEEFARLFDRGERYAALTRTLDGVRSGIEVLEPTAMARMLMKLKREFDDISVFDFFPNQSRQRAADSLAEAEHAIRSRLFPATHELGSTQQMRARQKFFRRLWITKKPLWADRLASAWLIRRFIDAEATIVWIDRNDTPHDTAVSFGFPGALFCNSATEVTYEVLLNAFGLAHDVALKRIASIVHALDVGGAPVPEAAGVEALLQGAQRRNSDEGALLPETEKTFDLLYDAYFQAPDRG